MKTILGLLMLLGTVYASGPTDKVSKKELKETLQKFFSAGDHRDLPVLESLLSEQFRVVVTDAEKGVASVLDRAAYLSLIEKKVIGGDMRLMKIDKIVQQLPNVAVVSLTLEGQKANFWNQVTLVKGPEGWKIVQDTVRMETK